MPLLNLSVSTMLALRNKSQGPFYQISLLAYQQILGRILFDHDVVKLAHGITSRVLSHPNAAQQSEWRPL